MTDSERGSSVPPKRTVLPSDLGARQNHEAAFHLVAENPCPDHARAPPLATVGELHDMPRNQRLEAVPGAETAAVDVQHLAGNAGGAGDPLRPQFDLPTRGAARFGAPVGGDWVCFKRHGWHPFPFPHRTVSVSG